MVSDMIAEVVQTCKVCREWAKPGPDNICSVEIPDKFNDQVEVDGRELQYVVTDLKPSVYYQFWVVANSLLGQGNASIIQGYRVARSKHNKGTC